MKTTLLSSLFALSLCCAGTALAQPPQRPLLPLKAWALPDYHAVESSEFFQLPADIPFDSVAAVTMNAKGNLLVLQRGPTPFLEFASDGSLVRAFGDGSQFSRSHGLRLDKDGNMWVTDVGLHYVRKLDADGNILLTLGTPGEKGDWDEATGSHRFDQPNETAIDSQGNLYVVQGHGVAEPKVLKFDPAGKFIKQWGGRGEGPGQFFAAHSIEIDANDVLYIADRENFRIERFDTDGNYLDEWKYDAMVCGIYLHSDGYLYMTSGFDGEFGKIDMQSGALLGALGSPGSGRGQFGEAHYLTLDAANNVYVADVVNRRVERYARE
ncbi:MAG TPA: peptidyl-alpha-hydroxyglycine alpha-amidating lyase family protein [Hyphomicrobiales bacterium]|nr:peptidyl-alpha-hydroxyglycine alpha-amidating lyase family protein [Hyphomicrobiales bacterium]